MSFTIADPTNPKPTTKHDPQARLDYQWGLDGLLDVGDTLDTVTWTAHLGSLTGPIVPGADVETAVLMAREAWAWFSISDVTQTGSDSVATLVGQTVVITCHFTTAAGRANDRSLYFKISDQ